MALDRNIILLASAGTGKTEQLSEYIISSIYSGIPLTRILALTFTEKAANEMKKRVLEKLQQRCKNMAKDEYEEKYKLYTQALIDIPVSMICTIHSFASYVLKCYPIESRVAVNFEVDEGEKFDKIFSEEWDNFILTSLPLEKGKWECILKHFDMSNITNLLKKLCSERYTADVVRKCAVDFVFDENKKGVKRNLEKLSLMGELVKLIIPFIENFHKRYTEEQNISFDGLLTKVHNLLKENSSVRRELKDKFDLILVDEFQDIDPIQGEIIFYLCEENDVFEKRWDRVKVKPGKIVVAGDPKQSIYGFRGADLLAFDMFTEHLRQHGAEVKPLDVNWRSCKKLIDFINVVGPQIFSKSSEFLTIEYSRVLPSPKSSDTCQKAEENITIHCIYTDKDVSTEEIRRIEADIVSNCIIHYVGSMNYNYKDIAILFRNITEVDTYITALRRKNIPYVCEGQRFFYKAQEVLDFVNLLKAISDPYDRLSLVGVLRSQLFGLRDDEILSLIEEGALDYLNVSKLERYKNVEEIYKFLRKYHLLSKKLPPEAFIQRMLFNSELLDIISLSYNAEQAQSNILKLLDIIRENMGKGDVVFTLDKLIDKIHKFIIEEEEEIEPQLADETINAVRLLTIHKSKGLEFPIVILADLYHAKSSTYGSDKSKVLYDWSTGEIGIQLEEICNTCMLKMNSKAKVREESEDRRLLYVALTRAKNKIDIFCKANAPKRDGALHRLFHGIMEGLGVNFSNFTGDTFVLKYNEVEEIKIGIRKYTTEDYRKNITSGKNFIDGNAGRKRAKIDVRKYQHFWNTMEAEYKERALPLFISPTTLNEDLLKGRVISYREGIDRKNKSIFIGILCHDILSSWDYTYPLEKFYSHVEKKLEIFTALDDRFNRDEIRREVLEILLPFVHSSVYDEISASAVLVKECPFFYKDGRDIYQGVIDLICEDKCGEIVVYDYKTDKIKKDEMKEVVERNYVNAYKIYSRAIYNLIGKKPKCFSFVFLRLGEKYDIYDIKV